MNPDLDVRFERVSAPLEIMRVREAQPIFPQFFAKLELGGLASEMFHDQGFRVNVGCARRE